MLDEPCDSLRKQAVDADVGLGIEAVSILGPLGAGARSLRGILLVGGVIGGHGLLVGGAIGRKGIVSEGLSVGAIGVLPGAL